MEMLTLISLSWPITAPKIESERNTRVNGALDAPPSKRLIAPGGLPLQPWTPNPK
jgi:hypothetical protein